MRKKIAQIYIELPSSEWMLLTSVDLQIQEKMTLLKNIPGKKYLLCVVNGRTSFLNDDAVAIGSVVFN